MVISIKNIISKIRRKNTNFFSDITKPNREHPNLGLFLYWAGRNCGHCKERESPIM